ncbi:hypothetical protein [Pseudobutyrivibrio sp. YE44]|uniref:hypothetical protein n=1 Tax=Pseudobutyrivibrio sp. YE44 TaxID=1520802 RepID=UPI00115F99FC|nr:hypothetical protein [Pseudobutyrivibrio sp. YE44]
MKKQIQRMSIFINNMSLHKGLKIFCWTNFLVVSMHIISSIIPFISQELEILIYLLKITIFCCLYKVFSTYREDEFSSIANMIKISIICDCLELFIYSYATDFTKPIRIVLYISLILKIFADYYICYKVLDHASLLGWEKRRTQAGNCAFDKKCWLFIHVPIILNGIWHFFFGSLSSLVTLLLLFFVRRMIEFGFIGEAAEVLAEVPLKDEEKINKVRTFSKKKKIGLVAIAGCFSLFFMLYYSYGGGEYHIEDDEGNILSSQTSSNYASQPSEDVYQYSQCNRLPEWTGFQSKRYGLVTVKNGHNTGAIYKDYLEFDSDKLAWDYDGHFIDITGKEILNVPYIIKMQKSMKQRFIDSTIKESCQLERFLYEDGHRLYDSYDISGPFVIGVYKDSQSDTYFKNGVAVYNCDFLNRGGVINDKGKFTILPKYRYIKASDDYRVFVVEKSDNLYVINTSGKQLMDDCDRIDNIDTDKGLIYYRAKDLDNENGETKYKIIDFNGNKVEGEYIKKSSWPW